MRPLSLDAIVLLGILSVSLLEDKYYYFIIAIPLLWLSRDLNTYLKGRSEYLATFGIMFFAAFDWYVLGSGEFQILTHVLCVMCLAFCFQEPKKREIYIIYAISLVNIVIAAATTQAVWFGGVFLAFIILSVFALISFQRSQVRHPLRNMWARSRQIGEKLAASSMIIILVVSTVMIFTMIPRYRSEFLIRRFRDGSAIVGFSENFSLGNMSRVYQSSNPEMVMRIYSSKPALWRAITYDHFDGRKWSSTFAFRNYLPRQRKVKYIGPFEKDENAKYITQDVELLVKDNPYFFTAWEPVAIEVSYNPNITYDDIDKTIRSTCSLRPGTKYKLHTKLPEQNINKLLSATNENLPEFIAEHYLQLPDALDPRVKELAENITAEQKTPFDKVRAIQTYLMKNYEYTLDTEALVGEGIEAFLFDVRAGHCKYFASSMAILSRCVGVPTRTVGGFTSGIYNTIGKYYIINQNHAHAWTEIYLHGVGWIPSNPSPITIVDDLSVSGVLNILGDEISQGWSAYVINFGRYTQQAILLKVKEMYRGIIDFFKQMTNPVAFFQEYVLTTTGIIILLSLMLLIYSILWRLKRQGFLSWQRLKQLWQQRSGRKNLTPVQALYLRGINVLYKEGFRKPTSMTAREFAALFEHSQHQLTPLINEFVGTYYQLRFAGETSQGNIDKFVEMVDRLKFYLKQHKNLPELERLS